MILWGSRRLWPHWFQTPLISHVLTYYSPLRWKIASPLLYNFMPFCSNSIDIKLQSVFRVCNQPSTYLFYWVDVGRSFTQKSFIENVRAVLGWVVFVVFAFMFNWKETLIHDSCWMVSIDGDIWVGQRWQWWWWHDWRTRTTGYALREIFPVLVIETNKKQMSFLL